MERQDRHQQGRRGLRGVALAATALLAMSVAPVPANAAALPQVVPRQMHAGQPELSGFTAAKISRALPGPVSTDGSCGPANGNKVCPNGFCCSSGGFCGTGSAWCGAGCQAAFGACTGSAPPSSASAAPKKTSTPARKKTTAKVARTTAKGPIRTTAKVLIKTTSKAPQVITSSATTSLRTVTTTSQTPTSTLITSSTSASLDASFSATLDASSTSLAPTITEFPQPPMPTPGAPLRSWLTQQTFERIFPFSKASAVYSNGTPFYTLANFLAAVEWLNNHPDPALHGFGTSSSDPMINVLEVAAFLASAVQETGDPSLTIPYPWAYPAAATRSGPEFNVPGGGGLLFILEGLASTIIPIDDVTSQSPVSGVMNTKIALSANEQYLLGTTQSALAVSVLSVANANQLSFGLGAGTGAGVVFQPGLTAVSDDGTLYGDEPEAEVDKVKPSSAASRGAGSTNRTSACLGAYCQYGGRGVQQLSYNFNYAPASLELFGDYRLVRYPNLIITADRVNFNGLPAVFGFPGPNPGGNNRLPPAIESTTPPAGQMAWITSLWFYMKATSSRSITCHKAMMDPFKYGITAANIVVNSQSGCSTSWAADKVKFYRRIAGIFGVPSDVVERSIVCPAAIQ